MGRPGIRELIGRAMVDKAFLAEMIKDPAVVLARYDLETEERAAIMQAISRTGKQSEVDRSRALQAALMKRWAT